MSSETPEALARQQIDAQLVAAGWVVQDYKAVDFSAGRGIALREVPLKTGPCDYLLLVDRLALGVIEAKKEGATLSVVAEQSARYASSLPDFLAAGLSGPLPFAYESTGAETYFRDTRDPEPRSRRVFSFHRPETLAAWHAEPDTLRARLARLPFDHPLVDAGNDGATSGRGASPLRDCQIDAITGLEKSFAENRPRALIHMATGAGNLLVFLKVDPKSIKLEPGFSRDVSDIGHFGTGDLELTLRNMADLERAKPFIAASYEAS